MCSKFHIDQIIEIGSLRTAIIDIWHCAQSENTVVRSNSNTTHAFHFANNDRTVVPLHCFVACREVDPPTSVLSSRIGIVLGSPNWKVQSHLRAPCHDLWNPKHESFATWISTIPLVAVVIVALPLLLIRHTACDLLPIDTTSAVASMPTLITTTIAMVGTYYYFYQYC